MVETNRLSIYAVLCDVMRDLIERQTVEEPKAVYMEMSEGILKHPGQWEWYTIRMTELEGGVHIGESSFKGIGLDGVIEIGYGISTECRGNGYATGAVSMIVY